MKDATMAKMPQMTAKTKKDTRQLANCIEKPPKTGATAIPPRLSMTLLYMLQIYANPKVYQYLSKSKTGIHGKTGPPLLWLLEGFEFEAVWS